MRPLERIEFIDQQILTLLAAMPVPGRHAQARTQLHHEVASFWAATDPQGRSRRLRLVDLRRALMQAELSLRVHDQTLSEQQAQLISTCLDLPSAWQRHRQPVAQRVQVYRPVLSRDRPQWRAAVPGIFVLVAGTSEGASLDPAQTHGPAYLFGLAQGIEAYTSLADLHQELCERFDDPIQGMPLLQLLVEPERIASARLADRLRYQWYADDPIEAQVDSLIEAQRRRINAAWAADAHCDIGKAVDLGDECGKRPLLDTRYALLLEKHLPNWLRQAGPQALAHIMQTLQVLVATGEQVAAPGILTLRQFQEQSSLEGWARQRVEQHLRNDLGLTIAPADIVVHVTHTRQIGPHLNPFNPSSYITWHGLKKVGGELVEQVRESLALDQLALRNVAWFDFDYWLTARVAHRLGKPLPAELSPGYIKRMVRHLSVGGSYVQYLRAQLIDSPVGVWRLHAHCRVNRARMRAEAAKARYAGHLVDGDGERSYAWVRQVLDYPHNALRPLVEGDRITVRQLLIGGHTLQGVLLINCSTPRVGLFVLYTPDAPDRRAWRTFASTRDLLRLLRSKPDLRDYAATRLAQRPKATTERLLVKGRLGPVLSTPSIPDDLFFTYYMAEVRGLLAIADANSRTTAEADVQQAVAVTWRVLDLISLVLPSRLLIPLSLGRMVIEIWGSVDAYRAEDLNGVLRHAYSVLGHLNDATTSLATTGLMRRLLRGMPAQPPLPMPSHYSVATPVEHLRYRIDGIYGEGVFEKASEFEGLSHYFIQDAQQRHYRVAFDGQRWRVVDPAQPDAYQRQPLKRLADGRWVIDSPLLWHDGLPDLEQLFNDCRLPAELDGTAVGDIDGLCQAHEQLYLQTRGGQLALRRHLLPGRYHLPIPAARGAGVEPWAVLRWQDRQWRIQVRQAGRSSAWLVLPQAYSVSRGSTASRR
ncbi:MULTISPECIES: dermonecrotic toxin domain-containing protein [unclassified Pseudomonas]|uniref:dermonecrotic toxin domain-containing protein n=1 Tax=unclassified Pseudomonas TaxID=196821 RepID=UPI000C8891DF|nr:MULTISPECIES: DUF6543 domain-containing protein [unclassified Pseudomonas]PNA02364.1 hypothetical protein C1X79_02215 [Pseudomonas sp. FW305-42]PNA26551.1 hypothetical protein C1X78_05630 [Pseudomonas sp. MPR-R1B]PNB29110.1 hypothetical protein C1X80_01765 [Pseudomonas sp. DP16D-E2]PNB43065.1 hypothetical protein C1X75_12370 [Pseudomonas sp. FW305-17]PNB63805.1 hypothetical protein C1X77_05165 [Pseudomonas sp. GW531-E2]